jgi:hypothetical protein
MVKLGTFSARMIAPMMYTIQIDCDNDVIITEEMQRDECDLSSYGVDCCGSCHCTAICQRAESNPADALEEKAG